MLYFLRRTAPRGSHQGVTQGSKGGHEVAFTPDKYPTDHASMLRKLSRELRARAVSGPVPGPYLSHAATLDEIAFDLLLLDAESRDA